MIHSTRTALVLAMLIGSVAAMQLGAPFLLIWPSARSTSLGGASVSFTGDPEVSYWNPGSIALQRSLNLGASITSWLPGLYPGMHYVFVGGSYGFGDTALSAHRYALGASLVRLLLGETDIVDEHGNFLSRQQAWRMALAIQGGIGLLSSRLGLGADVKYIASHLRPDWVWRAMPELGLDGEGSGGAVAVDIGAQYRPLLALSAGLTLANLGPNIAYEEDVVSDPLPAALRLGVAYVPLNTKVVKVTVAPEFTKVLVGMFHDTTGVKTFGRKLEEEVKDVWKSVGVEVSWADVLTVRVGYFEDLTGQRGGIVMDQEGQTYHYGLGDLLARRGLGRVRSIGLCWGFGLGWRDYARFDISSDGAIYDFPTANVKFALVFNDLPAMAKEVRRFMRENAQRSPIPPGGYAPGPRELVYTGSGVLLSAAGLFATCQHVVDKATSIEVYFPKRDTFYPAEVVVEDATNDVAVLRVSLPAEDSTNVPIALLGPEQIKLGMETFTVGYPLSGTLGKEPRYSAGSVSALRGIGDDPNWLQIQNPVQPGNSGGPLFSSDGRLIGIVVARLNALRILRRSGQLPENVNFAVKVSRLGNLIAEVPEGTEVLSRKSAVTPGRPEEVVEQVLPFVGYVLVRSQK
jgi:S1-C subfamily serine protease